MRQHNFTQAVNKIDFGIELAGSDKEYKKAIEAGAVEEFSM
ncbi:hypothetical protein [Metabacillus idriensis]|nr:hypothetical protein [Metabacillus idriensis]